jgi:hypothetical protein
MRTCKYKVGDEVVIVGYGHRFWSYDPVPGCNFPVLYDNKEEGYKVYDMSPELVGQKGTIDDAHLTQGIPTYSVNGPTKHAWYDEQQLELLSAPKNQTVRSDSISPAEEDRD